MIFFRANMHAHVFMFCFRANVPMHVFMFQGRCARAHVHMFFIFNIYFETKKPFVVIMISHACQ